MIAARDRLIPALDVPNAAATLPLPDAVADHIGMFNIGPPSCSSPRAPRSSRRRASVILAPKIVLDLKIHDAPNTMRGATRSGRAAVASRFGPC